MLEGVVGMGRLGKGESETQEGDYQKTGVSITQVPEGEVDPYSEVDG